MMSFVVSAIVAGVWLVKIIGVFHQSIFSNEQVYEAIFYLAKHSVVVSYVLFMFVSYFYS